jgi:peptidoglycan hydrolase-like protein with peptidoglycan-binding domain
VGDRGNDVRQLNANLHTLGYDDAAGVAIDPDHDLFTAATQRALEALQQRKGLDGTGTLDSARTVFLPESVRIARVTGQLGGSAQPGAEVAAATSETLEVQVTLDASQQGDVSEGDLARITLPGNRIVTGKVDRIGAVAQLPDSHASVGDATIPAFIALDNTADASGLDQAPVRVDITTTGVQDALSVPVTALLGKSGGGFAVEVVRADGRRELVAVTLGLFDATGGRVQVEGEVAEGDSVVVPAS